MPRHIDENDKNIKFMANILSSRRGKDKILDEYHVVRTMNKKEKPVVSCFIPAEAGAFFKCRFSYEGAARHGFPFSGLFIRDGEAIAHTAVLDPADMAAEIRGWEDDKGKTWYMQFRSFAAVGKIRTASKVPRKICILKLIIRRHNPNDPDKSDADPFRVEILPKYEEQEVKLVQ